MRNHVWTLFLIGTVASLAPLPAIAADPLPPSLANDCGRSAEAFLPPIADSQVAAQIPMTPQVFDSTSVRRFNSIGFLHSSSFQEQGAVGLQVLVDKDGQPAEVSVTDSSAPPEMEKAVMDIVKAHYRWQLPPPECRDRGVMVRLNYINTWALLPLQIYGSDPRYPAAARERKMGAAGIVEMTFKGPDEVWNTKVLISMGTQVLDDSMAKAVKDLVVVAIKDRNDRHSITSTFAVMFMPDFLAAPEPLNSPVMLIPEFNTQPGQQMGPP